MNTQHANSQHPRPNFRTSTQLTLFLAWMQSYRRDKLHALRDAGRNLRGFRSEMIHALKTHQVDYAFRIAIKRALRHV